MTMLAPGLARSADTPGTMSVRAVIVPYADGPSREASVVLDYDDVNGPRVRVVLAGSGSLFLVGSGGG